jgi:hypothetical protein
MQRYHGVCTLLEPRRLGAVQVGEHDPAEDAAAALRLYRRYWVPIEKFGRASVVVPVVPVQSGHTARQQSNNSRSEVKLEKGGGEEMAKENWPNLAVGGGLTTNGAWVRPLPIDASSKGRR